MSFLSLNGDEAKRMFLDLKETETTAPAEIYEKTRNYSLRFLYTGYFSWCIVTDYLLSDIQKRAHGRVVDIIAGSGFLAKKLRERGVEVDANGPIQEHYQCDSHDFGISFRRPPVAIAGDYDTVILSWPPYDNSLAADIWQAMRPNSTLIYIGEWKGGCCADDDFFEDVAPFVEERVKILQWEHIHDEMVIIKKEYS